MMRIVVFLLVVIVVLAVLAFALHRRSAAPPPREIDPADDPREILRRRYAAGEIDEDEYLRRMSGLSQDW